MLRIGLNPYGLTYTVGLQGLGTPRANPAPAGLDGFLAIAFELGAACVELDSRWLLPLPVERLATLRDRLARRSIVPICSHGLDQTPHETLAEPIRCTRAIGGSLLRMHATPVLEGARARWGARWAEMVDHTRRLLAGERTRALDSGVALALEDHQDFGSEELVAIATEAGDHVGIVLDTGNPFSVAEDPVAFTRRVAPLVRHLHLKDYRAQMTPEGFRLVRCALGDGCVPFTEIYDVLAATDGSLTASIELAALESRHIRLLTSDWWQGYPTRSAGELARALERLRPTEFSPDDDVRTPWERDADGSEIVAYEQEQLRRSAEYLRRLGWLSGA
jgi:sugar phosphate isomerase/epimerase